MTPLSSVLPNHYKLAFIYLRRRSQLVACGNQLAADAFITLVTPSSSSVSCENVNRRAAPREGHNCQHAATPDVPVFWSNTSSSLNGCVSSTSKGDLAPDPVADVRSPTHDCPIPTSTGKHAAWAGCVVRPEHHIWCSIRQPDSSLESNAGTRSLVAHANSIVPTSKN